MVAQGSLSLNLTAGQIFPGFDFFVNILRGYFNFRFQNVSDVPRNVGGGEEFNTMVTEEVFSIVLYGRR